MPMTTKTGRDLLDGLKHEMMASLIFSIAHPMLWVVGDSWLRYDGHQWWIGPDAPATEEQVCDLLAGSSELPKIWEATKSTP